MVSRIEKTVTQDLLDHTEIPDEVIFRDLAKEFISKLNIHELKEFMRMTKTDPRSLEGESVLLGRIPSFNGVSHDQMRRLLYERQVLYRAEITTRL